jgi:hypothetical protein
MNGLGPAMNGLSAGTNGSLQSGPIPIIVGPAPADVTVLSMDGQDRQMDDRATNVSDATVAEPRRRARSWQTAGDAVRFSKTPVD